MSYGVALRNGVPFTLGTIAALCVNATSQWSPLALWPNGASSPGMWISPSTLPASFNDSTGTTPVATPGSVADDSNPVGLALDIRAGAPDTLGPELVSNPGNPFTDTSGFTGLNATLSVVSGRIRATATSTADVGLYYDFSGLTKGAGYFVEVEAYVGTQGSVVALSGLGLEGESRTTTSDGTLTAQVCSTITGGRLIIRGTGGSEPGKYIEVGSVSFKEIPGNHMLQATATARPLESARVNLFGPSENMGGRATTAMTISTPTYLAPDGTYTATRFTPDATGGYHYLTGTHPASSGVKYSREVYLQAAGYTTAFLSVQSDSYLLTIDLDAITVLSTPWGVTASVEAVGAGWVKVTASADSLGATFGLGIGVGVGAFTGDGVSGINVWRPQNNIGDPLPYQAVVSDSDYDATGITPFQLYDGTDDGMATASFAAGTLINGMDCLIAVRRDSAANAVCGLYESVSDANKVFGIAESGSSSGCVGSGAGTPTVWVDNVQLTGGTAVTRGTLHTALTTGAWHILEFRGLDLSTWTASGFGLYTSYKLLGARGDIMLYPSTASTEDKDAARQYLADKYGVTLP